MCSVPWITTGQDRGHHSSRGESQVFHIAGRFFASGATSEVQEYWSGLPFSSPVEGFPSSSAGKEPACNAGDPSLIPGWGRSPGEGKGYPLQYSGLENSTDCIVHGVAESRTWLRDFYFSPSSRGPLVPLCYFHLKLNLMNREGSGNCNCFILLRWTKCSDT